MEIIQFDGFTRSALAQPIQTIQLEIVPGIQASGGSELFLLLHLKKSPLSQSTLSPVQI